MKKNYSLFLDKSLSIALLISAMFHITIFSPFYHFRLLTYKEVTPTLKITYLLPSEITAQRNQPKEETHLEAKMQMRAQDVLNRPGVLDKVKTEHKLIKKKVVKIPRPRQEKVSNQYAKVEIPAEVPQEEKELYLDYYQTIRESIRRFVERNYPRYLACGEVCLYFVLSADGRLKDINIIQKRSTQNQQLKEIAKRSIQQAAPFSPFPKELTAAQLSFNVLISFELEN